VPDVARVGARFAKVSESLLKQWRGGEVASAEKAQQLQKTNLCRAFHRVYGTRASWSRLSRVIKHGACSTSEGAGFGSVPS